MGSLRHSSLIEAGEAALLRACDESSLPDDPDAARVEGWMVRAYLRSRRER